MGLFNRNNNAHGNDADMSPAVRRRIRKEQKERDKRLYVRDNALREVVPQGGYHFYSNYFQYGKRVGRILTLIPSPTSDRDKEPFWKIFLIPQSHILNDKMGEDSDDAVFDAHGQFFDMMENKTKSWASTKQTAADVSADMQNQTADGSEQKGKARVRAIDNQIIASDRNSGDMYASTEYKVLITAKSLHDLDLAVFSYTQSIAQRFDGTHFEVYEGQQKQDFTNLLRTADVQLGEHPMATSSEYAGGYEILTRGITDVNGDPLGVMVGDVNNTAVLMDMDNYDERVVVSHPSAAVTLSRNQSEFEQGTRSSTLIGVRLAQAALINNHRVIHMILNSAKPQDIGADLRRITTVVSLNGGDSKAAINPFELFGADPKLSRANQLKQFSYFSPHINKLRLMVQQLTPEVESVDLNDTFSEIVRNFYINNHMLVSNPADHPEQLKLIGLPHDQYPQLGEFLIYLNQALDAANSSNNPRRAERVERIRSAFTTMYRDNPDLFDVKTDPNVDSAKSKPQVIYDFSSLRKRGINIAMAQFINALNYATDNLEERDVIILHGVDRLDDSVKDYVRDVFDELTQRGVRLVFLYDDTSRCIEDAKLNRLSFADWTMLGGFNEPVINSYQKLIQKKLPPGLINSILDYGSSDYSGAIYYLSRGIDNVLLALDLRLGLRHGDLVSENPKGLNVTSADK